MPALLNEGTHVYTHRFAASCVNMVGGEPYWRDVGTVDAYWEANMDLARVQPELNMYDPAWPIRTREECLPPAKFIFVSGASIHRSLLFTEVVVERGSLIEDSVVLPNVRIGRGVRLRRVVADRFCELPDGFEAGLDRAADEARFHVTPQGVVLVTPEMLGQHVHEDDSVPNA